LWAFQFWQRWEVNTYALISDLFRQAINDEGRAGLIVPSGLVIGFTYKEFMTYMLKTRTLVSFYGFENEDLLFRDITNKVKFGILTVTGLKRPVDRPWFTAHIRQPDQALDSRRRYSLTAEQIEAINPNTLNPPAFRWAKDAEVTAAIHQVAPVLFRRHPDGRVENPWKVLPRTVFNMATASDLFLDHADIAPQIVGRRGTLAVLDNGCDVYPLYEGKMLWHFDHRYGTYAGQTNKQANKGVLPHVEDANHDDPGYQIQPRYWVDAKEVRTPYVTMLAETGSSRGETLVPLSEPSLDVSCHIQRQETKHHCWYRRPTPGSRGPYRIAIQPHR
jgi:hypothetical protein